MGLTPLPSAPTPDTPPRLGGVAQSRRTRWRAASLLLVHVLVAAHVAHWMASGRTLTPMEPSEAMQTLERGIVNAGFILFALLIVTTLLFGRFFCGWACHMVAYQDLCGGILKRLGLRPKPFRSRLLAWVPLLAAFYMFVWPSAVRMWEGREAPTLVQQLTTDRFWQTFPGPAMSILTFAVCGFGVVWLLGNKGFCTYGCPYGAFFSNADRVSPGRIRVTDACDGCGHCTAACSSNVRVHEEVAAYGMIVDPGCMKCLDCVSVCPKKALYFGFGRPSIAKGAPKTGRRPRHYDFSVAEEIALAALFGGSLYAFRGLYDAVPFLLAIGLAVMFAFGVVLAGRAAYRPQARIRRWQLRRGGRTTPHGWVALGAAAASVVFVLHSALVQHHARSGASAHARAVALYDAGGEGMVQAESPAREALGHLQWVSRNGLAIVPRVEAMIGNLQRRLGRPFLALEPLRRASELRPDDSEVARALALALGDLGRHDEAEQVLSHAIEVQPRSEATRANLAAVLMLLGRHGEAARHWSLLVEGHPDRLGYRVNLALALASDGDSPSAVRAARDAVRTAPDSAEARHVLGVVLAEAGDRSGAIGAEQKALELDPKMVPARVVLCQLLVDAGRPVEAIVHGEAARALSPFEPDALRAWAKALAKAGRLDERVRSLIRAPAEDDASWYAAVFLYAERGDRESVRTLLGRLQRRRPELIAP